jgi:hypothetical protein
MGALDELLQRLHLRTAPAEEPEEPAVETPAVEEEETPVASPEVVEALDHLSMQQDQVVRAIELLDKEVTRLGDLVAQNQEVVRGLATDEVARLQNMAQYGEWFRSLDVATRDHPATPEEQLPETVEQAPSGGTSLAQQAAGS